MKELSFGDVERFGAKLSAQSFKPNGCIEWAAGLDTKGYGAFRLGSRMEPAHRVSYTAFVMNIPDGLSVLHRCDNPPCVNPKHLFLGTQQDNIADKMKKGRQPVGDQHYNTKVSVADIPSIKNEYASGVSQRKIAMKFGVSQSQISNIILGRRHE